MVFSLNILDPCFETVLDDFVISDVSLAVLDGVMQTRDLPSLVGDSVSRKYGEQDGYSLCG